MKTKKTTIYAENLLKIAENRIFEFMKSRKLKKTVSYALIFLIVAAGAGFYYMFHDSKKAEAAWWNDSWQYRKSIAVTNSSGGELTDFQVKVLSAVDLSADVTAGKVRSDLGDLRFTDLNGKALPYWIEDATAAGLPVTPSKDGWYEYNEVADYKGLNIAPDYYLSDTNNHIGKIYTGSGSGLRAFVRGTGGIYGLDLSHNPSEQSAEIGFRCAR